MNFPDGAYERWLLAEQMRAMDEALERFIRAGFQVDLGKYAEIHQAQLKEIMAAFQMDPRLLGDLHVDPGRLTATRIAGLGQSFYGRSAVEDIRRLQETRRFRTRKCGLLSDEDHEFLKSVGVKWE